MSNEKNIIEALVMKARGPISINELTRISGIDGGVTRQYLTQIKEEYNERGIELYSNNDEYWFASSHNLSEFFEDIEKREEKHLGIASLETLAIIMYRGPIQKTELDIIRGVDTNSVLRSLSIRKLIKKTNETGEHGSTIYDITPDLIAHLGIQNRGELHGYGELQDKIKDLERAYTENV